MTDNIDIRVRLQGGRVAAVEADGVAASIGAIGTEADRASTKLGGLRAAAAGFSGPMKKLGDWTRTGALYLTGFSAAAAGVGAAFGVKFDSDMEQATISMTHFLGSSKAAHKYLDQLYVLAAHTPFEFKSLTQTAQQFMAFGYSAKGAKDMLTSLADAAAGLGKSDADLAPVTLALGQIKAAGSLKGQDLNQLTSFGISATGIAKNLGMTYKEMRKAMEQGEVGSNAALKAIRKTMDGQFHGMAKTQSKTFAGQLSTLRDMAGRTLGKVAEPLFGWLEKKGLPGLNKALPGIAKGLGNVFAWLGKNVPKIIGAVRSGIKTFLDTIRPAAPFFQNVLGPLLKGFAIGVIGAVVGAVKVAVPLLKVLMTVLGWIGTKARPLRGVFQGIGTVLSFVVGGIVLKAIGTLRKFGGIFRLVGTLARLASVPFRLFGGVVGRTGRAVIGTAVAIFHGVHGAFGKVGDAVDSVIGFFRRMPGRIAHAVSGMWGSLWSGFKSVVNKIIGAWNGLEFHMGGTDLGPLGHLPSVTIGTPDMPMLAKGGIVRRPGGVIVGDAGPEVLSLPRGARVDPLPRGTSALALAGGGGGVIEVRVPVHLDGKKIAEAVGRAVDDDRNRR